MNTDIEPLPVSSNDLLKFLASDEKNFSVNDVISYQGTKEVESYFYVLEFNGIFKFIKKYIKENQGFNFSIYETDFLNLSIWSEDKNDFQNIIVYNNKSIKDLYNKVIKYLIKQNEKGYIILKNHIIS